MAVKEGDYRGDLLQFTGFSGRGQLPLAANKQQYIDSLEQGYVWENSDDCVKGNVMQLRVAVVPEQYNFNWILPAAGVYFTAGMQLGLPKSILSGPVFNNLIPVKFIQGAVVEYDYNRVVGAPFFVFSSSSSQQFTPIFQTIFKELIGGPITYTETLHRHYRTHAPANTPLFDYTLTYTLTFIQGVSTIGVLNRDIVAVAHVPDQLYFGAYLIDSVLTRSFS